MSNLLGRVPGGGGIGVAALGPVPNLSYSLVWEVPRVKEFGVVDRFRLGEVRREVLDNKVCCLLKGFLAQVEELVGVASSTGSSFFSLVLGKPLLYLQVVKVLISFVPHPGAASDVLGDNILGIQSIQLLLILSMQLVALLLTVSEMALGTLSHMECWYGGTFVDLNRALVLLVKPRVELLAVSVQR